ncbi:MAG: cytidine deaminase [Clostridia bacterium]|nr:cytidine deaminase [Clostridia bacterium]
MNKNMLCQRAIDALKNSYSPYSNCKVGAALLTESGKIYTGCNIENASFSPTICAERVAFSKAVSEGEHSFTAIAIAGEKSGVLTPFSPCGVCRQVMAEFCNADFKVLVVKTKDEFNEYTLSQLLPNSFNLKEI